ncbi:glycosyltransferase family 2 protein [Nocardioides sp. SOB77]|uniref:Glycosyltransferase family 2 protein n=1 Tax=Nocardioides oceani TaxID=3058369 RepID=A0ABT8FE68_9ACTN|nr:glycosyltransferase family 2 protein [Nocardioides oceani]MDN4172956.1 glycosyltransferase family 2 protein [Nocardioides oceani]
MTLDAIDIVVPFYGRVDYLAATVDSVLAQDDPRWRLTVVEDGRHDGLGTPAWQRRLEDPRVRWVTNPERLGLTRNFQRALDLVDHEWCVFPGCDDVLLPHYVRTIREVVTHGTTIDMVLPAVQVIDESGRRSAPLADRVKRLLRARQPAAELHGEGLAASLMHGNWLYFPALSWRSSRIKEIGFRQDLPTTLDLALAVEVVRRGGVLALTDVEAFQYRRHGLSESSLAASTRTRFVEERLLFSELEAAFSAMGWPRAARAARWHVTSRLHRGVAHVARRRTGGRLRVGPS